MQRCELEQQSSGGQVKLGVPCQTSTVSFGGQRPPDSVGGRFRINEMLPFPNFSGCCEENERLNRIKLMTDA